MSQDLNTPAATIFPTDCWELVALDQQIHVGPPMQFRTHVARKLVMKQSQVVSERKSWSQLTITIISGVCEVEFENEVRELSSHMCFEIPPHVPHRIKALTDLRAILTFDALH